MKVFLSDQTKYLSKHLDYLKGKSVMKYDKSKLTEKVSEASIDKKYDEIDLQFFFDYYIFPGNIMSFLTQWEAGDRSMKVGDTIVQQVYLPPLRSLSQKVIFGVRVGEIIDEESRQGFSYETLDGHVEKGISEFTIEKDGDSSIFRIHTFSTPGNVLTKMLGPIFSVPYQTYCTKRALKNVKDQIEKS